VSYTHFPEPFEGPEEFKEMLSQTRRYFPDVTIAIDKVLADGDQAVVHCWYRGTFQEGEMFGVEASGQSVEVAGMTRYHVADGKLQREQGIVDNFGLMMQLGAMPVREQ
jgi:predicted ester cyclase